jgi:hypothetical protein
MAFGAIRRRTTKPSSGKCTRNTSPSTSRNTVPAFRQRHTSRRSCHHKYGAAPSNSPSCPSISTPKSLASMWRPAGSIDSNREGTSQTGTDAQAFSSLKLTDGRVRVKMHRHIFWYTLRRCDAGADARRTSGMASDALPRREYLARRASRDPPCSPSLVWQANSDTSADPILAAAKALATKLREKKAFTNTATFSLKCEVRGPNRLSPV